MLTLTNRIDMRPGAVPLVIHLGQYDSDFSLVFELYSSAGNFTVESGTTAMIRGTKTDGNAYDADAALDISAKTVTVAGSEQMTAAKGRNVYELVLTKSGKVLSTANFILDVERAAMDADTIASESVLKELNAIIAGAETATEAAQTATAAAESVSGSTAQIATNTANIATNTADISDLKEDLSDLESDIFEAGGSGEYPHKTVLEMFSDGSRPGCVIYPPSSATTMGIVTADGAAYNSWYVKFTEATDIFFDASLNIGLFFTGQISNVTAITPSGTQDLIFTGTNPVRNRYTDGTGFPTETNKMHVSANDTIMISLGSSVNPSDVLVYYGEKQSGVLPRTVLNENVKLNDTQIEQVLSDEAKEALLACFAKVAWIDEHGQDYYDALYNALYTESPAPSFNYGIYDPESIVVGKYIDANGDIQTSSGTFYIEDYIPVVRSNYWIGMNPSSLRVPAPSTNPTNASDWRISEYDVSKEFIKQTHFDSSNALCSSALYDFDSNTKYIRLGWSDSNSSTNSKEFDIENPSEITRVPVEVGNIDASTGADAASTTRVRTVGYIEASNTITITGCPFADSWSDWISKWTSAGYPIDSFFYVVRCYDSNKAYLGSLSYEGAAILRQDINNAEPPAGTAYIRMLFQTQDHAALSITCVNHLITINGTKYYMEG